MTLFDVGENKEYLNDSVQYKSCWKNIIHGNTYLFKLFSPKLLCNKLIHGEYDIIVSYLQSSVTRIVSGYKGNAKLVSWIHNDYKTDKQLKRLFRSRNELISCYNKYDYNVFVSKVARESFGKLFPEILCKTEVIYNTIDDEKIRQMASEEIVDIDFDNECLNLISVGRFVEQKAFDRLLKIISKLIHYDKLKVRLIILGKGPLESKYQKIIDELGVKDSVILPGYKSNPYKYIKKSDLFVCSSLHEGYSTAVTESLILGTPVITTECSGMKELLGENNKYGLITQNSEEALYEAVRTVVMNATILSDLTEKAIYRGKQFSKKELLKCTEAFFDKIMGHNDEATI